MAKLDLELLGAYQIILDKQPVGELLSDKSRALLAFLAVESHRYHRREYLAGLLWPEQPEKKSLHNLRQALFTLRKGLNDDNQNNPFIVLTRDTIQFNPQSNHYLDTNDLDHLITKSLQYFHKGDGQSRIHIRALIKAISLYKGHFLDQYFIKDSIFFEEWSTLQREKYLRMVLQALNLVTEYYEKRGDCFQALEYATRMVELAPWEESAHRSVMHLLALNGQWGAATDQYQVCSRYLREGLALEPSKETTHLYEEIRAIPAQSAGIDPRYTPLSSNLPTFPNTFVGRNSELDDIADILADPHCRLLTITGPGGVGKSRLAIEAAREQIGLFDDGVFFVSFGDNDSYNLIISRISETLNLTLSDRNDPKPQLLEYLHNKKLLLVFDNFESIIEHAGLIPEILDSAPGVLIITATRERLNLKEEWLVTLEGLNFPDEHNHPIPELIKYDAVNLYESCAKRIKRNFTITPEEQTSIIRICQLVEGIPLAIELAAASTFTRSCAEIAALLQENLNVLSAYSNDSESRQNSISAAIQHSWDLLCENEKEKLCWLSVFQGEFDLKAAHFITSVDQKILTALINKSLLRQTNTGRYTFHKLIRQYATDKLATNTKKQESIEIKYCEYYKEFLLKQAVILDTSEQTYALHEINININNILKTWDLLISQKKFIDIEELIDPIYRFHAIRSLFKEAIELFQKALSVISADSNHDSQFNKIISRQGALYHRTGQLDLAQKYLEQGLYSSRSLSDASEIIFCLVHLGNTHFKKGNYFEVQNLSNEALELAHKYNNVWGISSSYYLLGHSAYRIGEIKYANENLEKCLVYSRASDRPRLLLKPLNALGDLACHQGDYAKAISIYQDCIRISKELEDLYRSGIHLNNLGTVYHALEKFDEAEKYYLESLYYCEKIGDTSGQAIAFSNLGEIAISNNKLTEAKNLFESGLELSRENDDHWSSLACLKNLGKISLLEKEWTQARNYYNEAFQTGMSLQTKSVVLNMLVDLAEHISTNGNPKLAGEILILVQNHPASEKNDRERANQLINFNCTQITTDDPRALEVLVNEGLSQLTT